MPKRYEDCRHGLGQCVSMYLHVVPCAAGGWTDGGYCCPQSNIPNHRAGLYSTVRAAFRANINETDEAKVGQPKSTQDMCLSRTCGVFNFVIIQSAHVQLCALQIEEQKDA